MKRTPQEWAAAYERMWADGDESAAVELYTEDATYQRTPFEPPFRGREEIAAYARRATSAQHERNITLRLLASGPEEHFIHFRAELVTDEGPTTLDGVLAVHLEESGLCSSLREWWHATTP
jgi:hypothetical protein